MSEPLTSADNVEHSSGQELVSRPAKYSVPQSFQVNPEVMPVHRRSIASRSIAGLVHRHTAVPIHEQGRLPRRRVYDSSLYLIDTLVNRSVDPMFEDSQLVPAKQPVWLRWFNRILAFIFAVAVGFAGTTIVQELQLNTREKVRAELADQVIALTDRRSKLQEELDTNRAELDKVTKQLNSSTQNADSTDDSILNGTSAVTGPGIRITMSNPVATAGQKTEGRVTDGQTVRMISDIDIQTFVARLWSAHAEAIAINGVRLGVQTSIRLAGTTIVIGVTPVESPYKIEAIGDTNDLKAAASAQKEDALYDELEQSGIYPDVSSVRTLQLPAIASSDITYARGDN